MIQALTGVTFENILVEVAGTGDRKTGVIRLHRPKQLNALSDPSFDRTIPDSVPSGLVPGGNIQKTTNDP